VLADLLDPGQGVDLHEGVRDADDVRHVHDALTGGGEGGRSQTVQRRVGRTTES